MGFFSVQNQTSESYGNSKTTLENGGRNPPDVTLDDIAKDLLSFFNRFECLRKTKQKIEEKYDIKNEYGDYWSADDIKRAWGKTQRMDKKSDKRKHWARVIILQMLKRLVYNGCKQNAAHEDHDDTSNEINQSCGEIPRIKENSEDTSSESHDELKIWRAGLCAAKHAQSSAVSESQLSASSNENKDTEQRKSIDKHELNFTDIPDRMKAESEKGRGEDGLWSTYSINQAFGKVESMKGYSEDRSTQSKAELETVEAAGGDKQSSGANGKSAKSGLSQAGNGPSGIQFQARSQATRNGPGAPGDKSGSGVSTADRKAEVKNPTDETIYIRIPVLNMFDNEKTVSEDVDEDDSSQYKLMDGYPSNTDIRRRKSYTMSFSNETNNAEWVYEILNTNTLQDNCKSLKPFENNYHKGHLAADRNHRWCREARNEANLFSNIIPQHKKLNQGMWRRLENRCRKKTQENLNCNVHVYTGPLYLRVQNDTEMMKYFRVRRPSRMNRLRDKVIPTHLFKVIIVEDEDGTVEEPECYMIPNKEPEYDNLDEYRLQYDNNIQLIEMASGLTFTHNPNANTRDYIKTVRLHGQDMNDELCSVDISVRISS